MKKTLKVFSIIAIVFMGFAVLGCVEDMEGFGYVLLVLMVWLPQSIISLIVANQDDKEKKL